MELRWIDPNDPSHDPLFEQEQSLRFRVLRDPLGLPPDAVLFPFEKQSLHLVVLEQGRLVACVLFHPESPHEGRLFQMAVEPNRQGTGLGRRLVAELERGLRERGYRRVTCHARHQAVGFYQRMGYRVVGEPFTEVGIVHRHMEHRLHQASALD